MEKSFKRPNDRFFGHNFPPYISFWKDGEEISLRVDLRSITKSQLQAICHFANETDLIIKYHDTVYECSMENLSSILRESEANAFLTDPRKYLQEK